MAENLSQENLELLKRTTNFTEEQIFEWHQDFLREFPDAKLNRAQFHQVFEDVFEENWARKCPKGSTESFCKHVFRACDGDRNGLIDFHELMTAIDVTANGSPTKKLEWSFKIFDINGDGVIEKEEMVEIVQTIFELFGGKAIEIARKMSGEKFYEYPAQTALMIFETMDKNHDKVVSFDEFVRGCLQNERIYEILVCEMVDA